MSPRERYLWPSLLLLAVLLFTGWHYRDTRQDLLALRAQRDSLNGLVTAHAGRQVISCPVADGVGFVCCQIPMGKVTNR